MKIILAVTLSQADRDLIARRTGRERTGIDQHAALRYLMDAVDRSLDRDPERDP